MANLLVHFQESPLRGTVMVPGDKSISHRAVMLAALADGPSKIRNWLPAGDTLATLWSIQTLGIEAQVRRRSSQAWDLAVNGRGLHRLQAPESILDCRNAGTCMRLLTGILAGQRFPSILDGSDQLRRRPMGRIIEPLRAMGADIESLDGRPPLRIKPASLRGIDYVLPVASAQVKSAILLAGLYADGMTWVRQPGPARDHTERMLQAMGVPVRVDGDIVTFGEMGGDGVTWGPVHDRKLKPLDITVPGDISSAAFPLVAAAIVPNSNISILEVCTNETRTGLLDILKAMGARFDITNLRITGGEPAADIVLKEQVLHSTGVGGNLVVRAIDEFPAWSVAATQAAGASVLRDALELRVKEVDRISMLTGELRKLGAQIEEYPDGFSISGPTQLRGAEVDSHGDHRLGMALAVAGLVASGSTLVKDADCIADSFPAFTKTMQTLGANMEWIP